MSSAVTGSLAFDALAFAVLFALSYVSAKEGQKHQEPESFLSLTALIFWGLVFLVVFLPMAYLGFTLFFSVIGLVGYVIFSVLSVFGFGT